MRTGRRWAVRVPRACHERLSRWQRVRRGGERSLAAAGLLFLAGAAVLAQSAEIGSLSGKLTDLHSKPLDSATVILRNEISGTEARTTTARNGTYRFSGLPAGEYTLEAGTPQLGRGTVAGIVVAAGHEARVQAALELDREAPEPVVAASPVKEIASPPVIATESSTEIHGPLVPTPVQAAPVITRVEMPPAPPLTLTKPPAEMPAVVAAVLETTIAAQPVETLALSGKEPAALVHGPTAPASPGLGTASSSGGIAPKDAPKTLDRQSEGTSHLAALSMPIPPAVSSAITAAVGSASELVVKPASMSGSGLAVAVAAASTAQALLQAEPSLPQETPTGTRAIESAATTPTVTGEQLEALPLAGRRWEKFALDAPAASGQAEEEGQGLSGGTRGATTPITVDGASTRLAFSGRSGARMLGSSLMGPGRNEAAIREVQTSDWNGDGGDAATGRANVATQRGMRELHGQGFLFDRQNLWGAKNPFTEWVQETAPATLTTSPVFTPLPYSPPDREATWGVGLGGPVIRKRLFWFAAFDANQRNNPGVSSVKHPDHFFAQPSNDEMQVLSARLGLSSRNPVAEGLAAYSTVLESLAGLLGPAARTATQWGGFGRLDWDASERNRFALEGSAARWESPGGGLYRASEVYGNHSFGDSRTSEMWLLGRWEGFLTPNLLAVTQGSVGRHILSAGPETPSAFEQKLNASSWGQLPQITVDGRYGFTIGNPARFGSGSYPDEHVFAAQEGLDWVKGGVLVRAGLSLGHNADSTSMVRNHTGSYYYSSVENFTSDALVFAAYGLSNALDPMNQHNCDTKGKAWRDATGQLHGLGYLPCYSYYTQTLGPTNWHLSTNDWAGYVTAQWQPANRLVLSTSLRWELEQLPPPIALVNNPDLPLTQKLPNLGNEWGPRASLAWGSGESHWPMLRLGYGMYFGRTNNLVLETALTQTGSPKGDLNFFMRPTDNLNGGGAPPFPYVLVGEPASVQKPGAVEFASNFHNAEVHQGVVTVEETLPGHVKLSASAEVSLGRRLPVTIDTNIDPAVNPKTITYAVQDGSGKGPLKGPNITVPFFANWPVPTSTTGLGGRLNPQYQQITEIMSRANSTYEAAMLRISRSSRRGLTLNARYTYAHAMDWNPNESNQVAGAGVLDPNDFSQEYGTSNLDVRHSASTSVIWQAPWKLNGLGGRLANGWMLSGIGQFRTGLPYTMRTAGNIAEQIETTGQAIVGLGPGMNGYGGDSRVYGVGRNTYRYPETWKADVRVGRKFSMGRMRELQLMAESFNLFNHQNVTRIETVGYSIEPGSLNGTFPTLTFLTGLKPGQTEFGKPLDINATDFFRERQIDFGMRVSF